MKSMTAYAEVIRPLESGSLRLTLRSVNSKGLDLSLRLHPALFPLEPAIRAKVREYAQRGKLDLSIDVQDEPSLEPHLNRSLLRSVAKAWAEEAEWLKLPPFTPEAFLRLPGAWMPAAPGLAERLEKDLAAALEGLLELWNQGREAEGGRLRPCFENGVARLQALREALAKEAEAQAAELPELYRQRLQQVLEDARLQGQLPAERVVGEAAALAERQDVREELVRLRSHLEDCEGRLKKNALGGRALDIWCQEVLREINTTGSKCKRLAMTRLVMEAKQELDQMREQGANLE
jgi:uncharacterized protein (TIGR00255 family)